VGGIFAETVGPAIIHGAAINMDAVKGAAGLAEVMVAAARGALLGIVAVWAP
jgi:hypothetical protein